CRVVLGARGGNPLGKGNERRNNETAPTRKHHGFLPTSECRGLADRKKSYRRKCDVGRRHRCCPFVGFRQIPWRGRLWQTIHASACGRKVRALRIQIIAIAAPPIAHRITTSQGGVCHMNSSRNAKMASAKSPAPVMPAVHTGL